MLSVLDRTSFVERKVAKSFSFAAENNAVALVVF